MTCLLVRWGGGSGQVKPTRFLPLSPKNYLSFRTKRSEVRNLKFSKFKLKNILKLIQPTGYVYSIYLKRLKKSLNLTLNFIFSIFVELLT
jgi:hypothetical protein